MSRVATRRVLLSRPPAAAGGGWWLSGGVSAGDCYGAWAAKGAASYAASLINLNNPGTNDLATDIAEPAFDTATGWAGNVTTHAGLKSSATFTLTQAATIFVRVNAATTTFKTWYAADSVDTERARPSASNAVTFSWGGSAGARTVTIANDVVIGMVGTQPWVNGAASGATIDVTFSRAGKYMRFMHDGYGGNGMNGYMLAIAVYTTTLTPPQAAAVMAAMAAL